MNNGKLATIAVVGVAFYMGTLAGCSALQCPPVAKPAPAPPSPPPPPTEETSQGVQAAPAPPPDFSEVITTGTGPGGPNLVRVFFGTDRNYRAGDPVISQFGPRRGSIRYGSVEVNIPPDHRLGNLESPSLLRLEFSPNSAKHVVLQKISVLSADDYFHRLAETVQKSAGKSALVFVHGYNVSFVDAARRTAQMTYDLQFAGAPIFYSWPSAGRTQDYAVDETNVEWSGPHLTQFLVDVLSKTDSSDVYLIAHSMGNRALANSVADVEVTHPELRGKIREIILAAPDIDADTFRDEIAPRIITAESPTTHLTLYASSRDEALMASKKFHGYSRAGDAGDLQLILTGLEYIDASSVDTGFLGHSYYGDNRSVIADIHYSIDGHLRAGKRFSLKEVQMSSGSRCVFSN